jgi:hypothetical protein
MVLATTPKSPAIQAERMEDLIWSIEGADVLMKGLAFEKRDSDGPATVETLSQRKEKSGIRIEKSSSGSAARVPRCFPVALSWIEWIDGWLREREMKIAVLGFGNVGAQLGRLWLAKGHEVTAGLREGSKDRQKALDLGVSVALPADAVKDAEVIAIALPWTAVESTLKDLSLDGKVVIDAVNPLNGELNVIVPPAGSAGLAIASWARGARVVKAFNTIGAGLMGDAAFDMMYCGDDSAAKTIVRDLIADTGMRPVDVGPLSNSRYLEQIAGLWVDLAVKGRLQGAFGFNLHRK